MGGEVEGIVRSRLTSTDLVKLVFEALPLSLHNSDVFSFVSWMCRILTKQSMR